MSSCIVVLYTTVLTLAAGLWCPTPAAAQSADANPDALYGGRATPPNAARAAEIWAIALQRDPTDVTAAWKLSRACHWLGDHATGDQARAQYERGVTAGDTAARLAPNRPEGHFWMAANMAGLAESQGMRAGLRYKTAIRLALERVLRIDPAYQQGSADRALGRWYYKVPGLVGGSKQESEAHLRKALTYNPQSTVTRYFLAETLIALGRTAEARSELQNVIDAPLDPDWTPEDQEWKAKARGLLGEIRNEK